MVSPFLDYLHEKNCITATQRDVVLNAKDDAVLDDKLFRSSFTFVETKNVPEEFLKQVELLVRFNFMSIEQAEIELLEFDVDQIQDEMDINFLDLQSVDTTFVEEYLSDFLNSAQKIFGEDFSYEKIEQHRQLHCGVLCYQKIKGPPDLLIGISAPLNILNVIGAKIYEHFIPEESEPFSGKKEDVIDAIFEFINSTNRVCTYKYNFEFDLMVPELVENVILNGNPLYKINFNKIYDLIILTNWSYYFEKEMA